MFVKPRFYFNGTKSSYSTHSVLKLLLFLFVLAFKYIEKK